MFTLKPTPRRFHDASPFPQRFAIGDHISHCCSTFPLDFVVTSFALRLRPNNVSTFPNLHLSTRPCHQPRPLHYRGCRLPHWRSQYSLVQVDFLGTSFATQIGDQQRMLCQTTLMTLTTPTQCRIGFSLSL